MRTRAKMKFVANDRARRENSANAEFCVLDKNVVYCLRLVDKLVYKLYNICMKFYEKIIRTLQNTKEENPLLARAGSHFPSENKEDVT